MAKPTTELWQEYNEQGEPVPGPGLTKAQCADGALHGAVHVWIWRAGSGGPEVLLQKRGSATRTWPGLLDISAAGHIDLGETPVTTALRETHEELGLELDPGDLQPIGSLHQRLVSQKGIVENEIQFLYLLSLAPHANPKPDEHEVHSIVWLSLERLARELSAPEHEGTYVPHSPGYFDTVLGAITRAFKSAPRPS